MPASVYIPGYTTDVFVSYAHIDNQPFGEERSRWVTDLRDYVRDRVASHLGASISIWFDDSLTGNEEFSDVLLRLRADVREISPGQLQHVSAWNED